MAIKTHNSSEYSKLLQDPRWQKRRLEILNRDNWTCQICGDTQSTLHVHHKFYTPGLDPWEYEDGVLVTLCSCCHEAETECLRGAVESLPRALLLVGANSGSLVDIGAAFYSCRNMAPDDFHALARIIEGYGVSEEIRSDLRSLIDRVSS